MFVDSFSSSNSAEIAVTASSNWDEYLAGASTKPAILSVNADTLSCKGANLSFVDSLSSLNSADSFSHFKSKAICASCSAVFNSHLSKLADSLKLLNSAWIASVAHAMLFSPTHSR
eukprot:gnl/MRDRNA2_/MRDRNA2_437468_c0_seq1.p1 gnl/MRDRNA2_/MRDRNA2_437468_c0~~gnl/MRDRNA2_/MRDRNA2_437468_c0_seq1.p1  ORF type:complete len:116 (-),score=11.30 gnl/MRDRNA2_/MRDRNA2_437468_c0_seq1:121-468(-)